MLGKSQCHEWHRLKEGNIPEFEMDNIEGQNKMAVYDRKTRGGIVLYSSVFKNNETGRQKSCDLGNYQ